jgi:outer membrane protein W
MYELRKYNKKGATTLLSTHETYEEAVAAGVDFKVRPSDWLAAAVEGYWVAHNAIGTPFTGSYQIKA